MGFSVLPFLIYSYDGTSRPYRKLMLLVDPSSTLVLPARVLG